MSGSRRGFLKLAGGAAAGAALADPIARALALPTARRTGTIRDLEHVVILMQENRSFDHYFGTLRGVRGFADPRPLMLPGGRSVFQQPKHAGSKDVVTPFRLNAAATRAQSLDSLDHSWKASHELWKWHDAWIRTKSPMTMGYFTREDLPFYYALADAFTICDAYHCSLFGPTNPNRMFLFTGTSGLAAGDAGPQVVANPPEEPNETSDPANDAKDFRGFRWPTYAERLEAAGVSWRLYQEWDNYGDNGLAYFANFRGGLDPASPLYRKGRAWVAGSSAANAQSANGEPLIAAFARDVAADTLPQVSWIVAPYKLCEHPSATPGAGEHFTARLIEALTANPEVWAKTALILNYDENDGFFDHMPPLVPPAAGAPGVSTVSVAGEVYDGVPVGLGPRVPMIVVSPWTKGGFVNSQTFDHTSVLRLLEARFGVPEPNITAWRRAVCGDLTSVFDFAAADAPVAALPDAAGLPHEAAVQTRRPAPRPPRKPQPPPRQEPGGRPARALPYAFDVDARVHDGALELTLVNTGAAGAGLAVYPGEAAAGGPWFYAVESGQRARDRLPIRPTGYDFTLYGPNGFLRRYRGLGGDPIEVKMTYDPLSHGMTITLENKGVAPVSLTIANGYSGVREPIHLEPGGVWQRASPIAGDDHWYDIEITEVGGPYLRRRAGHIETGRPSRSDPALDRGA